jgi:hypothetical protein
MFGPQTFVVVITAALRRTGRSIFNGPFGARLELATTTISRFLHELSEEDRGLRVTLLALEIPARSRSFATAYARVSNETPRVNAFCWVAPAVRFSDFAILPTGVFWRASVFSWRTSSLVHSRRLTFFAIYLPAPMFWGRLTITPSSGRPTLFIGTRQVFLLKELFHSQSLAPHLRFNLFHVDRKSWTPGPYAPPIGISRTGERSV